MTKYITITVRREILHMLEDIKEKLGAKSLGETIVLLIETYRKYKSLMFAKDVREIRKEGLEDIKEVIDKIRRTKWARL